MTKGLVIAGEFGNILVRKKSTEEIELGELLIAESAETKILMQAFDLVYGSQISHANRELISGMNLEQDIDINLMEPELRNYTIARMKNLITLKGSKAQLSKNIPSMFSIIRDIRKDDLSFLNTPQNPLFIGKLRSGSKIIDADIFLPGDQVLSHHILIPGTTGRGKSVFVSNMLWNTVDKEYCGFLVLDPHDEYYGRNKLGLKDHPQKERVVYYTAKNPPPGCRSLIVNLKTLRPHHFNGVVDFSDPQRQALNLYHKQYGDAWIESIILEKPLEKAQFRDDTLAVIRRTLLWILDIQIANNQVFTKGVFSLSSGETTIADIARECERGKTVIIDTSSFSGQVELLVGSLAATEIFNAYRWHKMNGLLNEKPVVSVVLEEAPRVLGKEILEKGHNIFSTIAREGRKFKVGLTAITQLPSLIPRDILANMNTKIILGTEMKPERQAIIDSASQDLSDDDRNIASLDKGEAIVSSNFAAFAYPIKIPFFDDVVRKTLEEGRKEKVERRFEGVNLQ